MVATKLSEVAGKGWGWFSGGEISTSARSESNPLPTPKSPGEASRHSIAASISESSPSSSLDYAQDSIQQAAEQTYSTLSGFYSASIGWTGSGGGISDTASDSSSIDPMIMENMPWTPKSSRTASSILTSPNVLNLFHNPYVGVRGGRKHEAHRPSSSMAAIRSLIHVVPSASNLEASDVFSVASSLHNEPSIPGDHHAPPSSFSERGMSTGRITSPSETASQLAEGTLRAFRDIALDEAVELHEALRYWSYRWERPLLAWLEAGPTVWFSDEGYQHQNVGQKVSQIQAVLARRCATIGDLQQHLLRAGWQRGVAQWGVLGDGGEWATVAGGDGRMNDTTSTDYMDTSTPSATRVQPPPPQGYALRRISSEGMDHIPPPSRPELPRKAPPSNVSQLPQRTRHNQLYYTSVFVKHNDGGKIMIDNPALAEWSVDAMSLVRRQLYRAANGFIILPYTENWAEGDDQSRLSYDVAGSLVFENETIATDETVAATRLPLWASLREKLTMEEEGEDILAGALMEEEDTQSSQIEISDLPLLVNEVSELLNIMESVIHVQRARRLEKVKPQWWLSRNWYLGLGVPPLIYLSYKVGSKGYGWSFLKYTAQKLVDFCREHVMDPFLAMYDEFTKGTEDISDREARNVTIKNLKKMIRSWLDETHPDMSVRDRKRMAKAMDISLIEAEKEESMKTIYNINSVIRMSFIEAQFLKKEMMNALLAMDEMRASTNFNMNLAAVTPFVLFVWTTQRTFKFVFYAMLKMGKSREETIGSFLHTLTEIERLLVMRDNPPTPPRRTLSVPFVESSSHSGGDAVLDADDLGMLMLHIHELRTILWQDRRRFSPNVIRSVAEDLAELAGERGAVSVRQQLQIISRMCRTYPFLKEATNEMLEYR